MKTTKIRKLDVVIMISKMKEKGFRGGSDCIESAYKAGDPGSVPGWGRSPGEGHGNSLQSSGLENPTDRGAWRATHRVRHN